MDTLANMFSTIENAQRSDKRQVIVPKSKLKTAILAVLKNLKLIKNFEVIDGLKPTVRIALVDRPIKFVRQSKSARRIYLGTKQLPKSGQFRHLIVSTPQGLMTATEAKKRHLGGELLAEIT